MRVGVGRLGLQLRFMLAAVVSAVLFALVAGWFAYQLGERRAAASARETLDGLVAAVEKTAAVAAYARDELLMRELSQGLARNPLVARVRVLDTQGHVLAEQRREGSAIAAGTGSVERRLQSPFDRAETLGVLRLELDAEQLQRVARREAWTLALLMVAQTALIALVIYLAGARLVSRPIVRLARTLAALSAGTDERLAVPPGHEHDEIGALVDSANALLQSNAQALQRERTLRHEIEAMEAQYRQIFDSTSAGIFVLDREGRLINGNPTVVKVIGGPVQDMRQLRGQDFLGKVFARPEKVRSMIDEAAERGETMSADLELRSADGDTRWVHCLVSVQDAARAASPHEVTPGGIVEGVLYDITERKRAERDVRRRAEVDALTGALNRAATEEAIDRFIAQAGADEAMTLLYLDLDGFKQVNDRFGHKAGDQVLQQVAVRIQRSLRRSTDLLGRIGGDEFAVVLQHANPDETAPAQIAAALLEAVREPVLLDDGQAVEIGVSIGLAGFPRHGRSRRELMHAADGAMYAVKRHGKNGYASAVFNE
jgi:diguanylate cyclase (GGDEF)-like protein/PAS domain S-box-containing protein